MDYTKVIEKYGKDFTTEWAVFKDGAVGCIVNTIGDDVYPQTGWSICSPKDQFDPIKGEAIALLRAKNSDKAFDMMFRNIPTQYYKDMILRIFDVKPM